MLDLMFKLAALTVHSTFHEVLYNVAGRTHPEQPGVQCGAQERFDIWTGREIEPPTPRLMDTHSTSRATASHVYFNIIVLFK